MNDFLYPSNSKIYEKEPRYNKTSVWRTNFASPLALHYIEVPLCLYLVLLYGKYLLLGYIVLAWLPQVRKQSGEIRFLQGQGKVIEFHLESGKT